METKRKDKNRTKRRELPVYKDNICYFEGYDPSSLMAETAKLRNLITKRGTLEILIPLCCSTKPIRYKKFRETMKGISSKTLAYRLQELEKGGILERHSYNEIPPRVEYNLTAKGQELVQSVIDLLQWMRKWSLSSVASKDDKNRIATTISEWLCYRNFRIHVERLSNNITEVEILGQNCRRD